MPLGKNVFLPKGRVLPGGWNRWREQETPSSVSVPSEHRHAWARKKLAFGLQVQVWFHRTGWGASPKPDSPYAPSHLNPHPVLHIQHLTLTTQRPGIRVSKPDCLPYEQGPCVECTVGQVCLGPDSPRLSCFAGTFMEVRMSDQLQGCASCPQGEISLASPAPHKVRARPVGRLPQKLRSCPQAWVSHNSVRSDPSRPCRQDRSAKETPRPRRLALSTHRPRVALPPSPTVFARLPGYPCERLQTLNPGPKY